MAFGASVEGTWAGADHRGPQTIVLHVNGRSLSGAVDGIAISNAGVSRKGDEIWFKVVKNGATTTYKGSINGAQMKLFPDKGSNQPLMFSHR